MFYDIFLQLCNDINKKPSTVANEIGFDKSLITHWKQKGFSPKDELKQRIASYFNVSVDYLLGNEKKSDDDELTEYLDELRNRSEMRMLFSVSKGATKEEVEQAVKIIEALRKTGDGENE